MGVWYYPVGSSYGAIYKAHGGSMQDIMYIGKAVPQHSTQAYGIVEV